ncbi:MAG: hypothetical protein ACT452_04595 [Microthrixaceae bacterium]
MGRRVERETKVGMRRLVVIGVCALGLSAVVAIPAAAPATASEVARIEVHPALVEVLPDTQVTYTVEAFDGDDVSLGLVDAELWIHHAPQPPFWPGGPVATSAAPCRESICQSTQAGDNTVVAVLGNLEASAVMTVRPGEPVGIVAVGPTEGRAGEIAPVYAAVVDQWRNRTGHGPISFLIAPEAGGGGSGAGTACETDTGCSAEIVGDYRITAYYDLPGATLSAVHRVTIGPNVPGVLTMTATPHTVYGTVFDNPRATIRITVTDAYGNPTPSVLGIIELTENQTGRLGHGTPQPPQEAWFSTAADGTQSFTYAPGLLAGRDTYTARVDQLTATTTITYLPLPIAP